MTSKTVNMRGRLKEFSKQHYVLLIILACCAVGLCSHLVYVRWTFPTEKSTLSNPPSHLPEASEKATHTAVPPTANSGSHDEGSLGIVHLWVAIAVLSIEIYVIWCVFWETMHRNEQFTDESTARQITLKAFDDFRNTTGRNDYMKSIASAIEEATREIIFTSYTMATSDSDDQSRIVQAVKSRKKGVLHRGIVAKRPEAIPGALEVAFHDVEIVFSDVLNESRFRLLVADGERCILGYSEGEYATLETNKKTTMSSRISSHELGSALNLRFEQIWTNSESLYEYCDNYIIHRGKTRGVDLLKSLRKLWRLEHISDMWLAGKCPRYHELWMSELSKNEIKSVDDVTPASIDRMRNLA